MKCGTLLAMVLPLTLASCAGPAGQASAPPLPSPPPAEAQSASFDPGPRKGERVPAFELPDQGGKMQSLESLRGPNGLFLNFNRSVVW
ncbi:MAG TPA: hypothetical protein VFM88_09995 [Vicinamibacteria bacterium]|nr:hypothetical protein [Vicinamibacteria bacterium]